jgi:hypothetical protein
VAEGARLESVFTRKGNVGSNPTLSATQSALQEKYARVTLEFAGNGRTFAILAREPDWRKRPN